VRTIAKFVDGLWAVCSRTDTLVLPSRISLWHKMRPWLVTRVELFSEQHVHHPVRYGAFAGVADRREYDDIHHR
jgi:hypothetical protein